MDVIANFRVCLPLFNALGDSQRQAIILTLARLKRASVNELAGQIKLSRPAISHHLKVLRDAGIASCDRDGTKHMYYLELSNGVEQLKQLITALEQCEGYKQKLRKKQK